MTTEDRKITEISILAPLWAPDSWSDEPLRRGWATMRLPFRWRVVRVQHRRTADGMRYEGCEGVSAHWTEKAANRAAERAIDALDRALLARLRGEGATQ